MKIIFFGTPDFAVPALEALADTGHAVALVVTQPDRPRGRGHRITPCPVKSLADRLAIPTEQPETIRNNRVFFDCVTRLRPDLIVVAAYGNILPEDILMIPRLGCVNIHASLLPKYRGAAPIHRAVQAGERETGVSLMRMSAGMDEGDVIATAAVAIGQMDTGQLHDRLADVGADLLIKTLPAIEAGAMGTPQDHESATYAPMIEKGEGHVNFSLGEEDTVNLIRGMNPFPGAFVVRNGETWKIRKARRATEEERKTLLTTGGNLETGVVIEADRTGISVRTEDGAVVIEEIQPPGKRSMTVDAFLRGYKIDRGERFR
jgi:methionyl-tRNA formyltransferase